MGQLRARVGGQWVDILGSGPSPLQSFGVVAKGTMVGVMVVPAAGVVTAVTQPLNFTPLVGRRYRITLMLRATRGATQVSVSIRDGSVGAAAISDVWFMTGGGFGALLTQFLIDGDGVNRNFLGCVSPTAANIEFYAELTSFFIIEDVGPNTSSPLGSAPIPVSPMQPLGIVAMGAMTNIGGAAIASNTIDVTQPLAFTAQIGRRYRLVCRCRAATGSAVYIYLRASGGPITTNDVYRVMNGTYDEINLEAIFDGNGVASTYKVTASSNGSAQIWTDQPNVSHFYIEDIGPNMTPAAPIPDTPPAWTAVGLAAPWSNIGGTSQSLQYRKIGDIVQIRGELRFTMPGGNPVAVLPVGFRPPGVVNFAIANRTTPTGALVGYVGIDGTLNISGLSANTDMGLGMITFSTTA